MAQKTKNIPLNTGYELPKQLASDPKLSDLANADQKMLLLSLANTYEADLTLNLGLDSLDLHDKYPHVSAVEWRKFLSYPIVKKFIGGFLEERAEKRALRQLGSDDIRTSDALKIKQDIDANKPKDYNQNITIVFMPQKDYSV